MSWFIWVWTQTKATHLNIFIYSLGPLPWSPDNALVRNELLQREMLRAVSGLLREDEAERGSGSSLVSPSLGMFLLEKGSAPLSLPATTPSRFSIIVKQRTKQGNETVQFEFRIPQLLSSFTAYPSLHPLPSARSLTCSFPTNFTPFLLSYHSPEDE